MEKFLKILKECPLFSGVESDNLEKMLNCFGAVAHQYDKNEFIFAAGDEVRSFGIVLSGSVHVVREDYWGNRFILAHIPPGGLFGEAFSFAETVSFPVSVTAAEKTKVLLIDYRHITAACVNACGFHVSLIQNMMKILAQKNIMLTGKMEILTHRTTRARLLAYLSEQAEKASENPFTIPFNRQQLADYLSVERSAMSAELSKMQSDGLIKTNKSEFELLV